MKTVIFVVLCILCFVTGTTVPGSSKVLLPTEFAGTTFEAVVYASSPSNSFENISIQWYEPTPPGAECTMSTFQAQAEGVQALIITKTAEQYCLLETVGKIAYEKGFSAVIWRTAYTSPGYSAQSSWASNTSPIPMFEVSGLSPALKEGVTEAVYLVPDPNRFKGMNWVGPQIPFIIILGLLALYKIFVCVRALPRQSNVIQDSREVSAAQLVIIFEPLASIFTIIHLFDFMGQFHILPLPVWFNFMIWSYLFTFTNTFNLAKAMLSAEAAIRHVEFAKNRSRFLNVMFIIFFVINVIINILLGWEVYYTMTVVAISTVSFIIFQAGVAIHFLLSKRRLLKLMTHSAASRDNVPLEQVKNLKRMSFYLYVSAFFMLAYLVSLIIPGYGALVGSIEIVIFSSYLSVAFNSLTGLAQILSLPEKVTGIRFIFDNTTAKDSPSKPSSGKAEPPSVIRKPTGEQVFPQPIPMSPVDQ
jgi:hypothetical protein